MATMAAIEGLLLLVMAVVGALCAVQDIRKSIVPNCWIAAGIMIAAVLQTIDQLFFAREYGAWWLANMAVGDALAILMYAAGLWAAGDAKLFLLMYLCVPSRLIEPRTLSCAVIPYCFIFIPAVVWLITDSVYLTLRHAERFGAARLSARDGLNMLAVMLEVTVWQAVFYGVFPTFWEENALLASALMMACAYACAGIELFQKRVVIVLHGAVLVLLNVLGKWRFSPAPWWMYLLTVLSLLFTQWASGYNYRRIPTAEVKRGTILSAGTVIGFRVSNVKNLPQNAQESMKAKLTEEEAQAVRRWEKSRYGQPTVVVGYSFTTGAKASFTDTRNRLNYDNSNVSFTQNDFFRYKEQIYALYADYSHNFGSHFSMKAGLRLEHTRTTGISESQQTTDKHDYTRLFPTFYLMYKPNEDNVLNMNISSRISRPAQNMVNPFLTYENKYSEHRGKEDLKPSYRYNAEFSYTLKNNLNFSIFYSYATDVFSQRLMLNEETHVLSSLWDNYMKNRSFGITNSYTFRLGWLQTFAQHTLKYNRTTSSAPETHPKNSGWDYNINIRNTFYLNTAKTLVASLSGYYSGPSHDQVSHREGSYGASGGIRYSMLGNKLNLSLNVSDFLVKNMQGTSYSNGLYAKFNNTFTYTSFRIGVSYNFGADIKRKKHNLSNTDIQNRL